MKTLLYVTLVLQLNFYIITTCFANIDEAGIKNFSQSKQWLRLMYYEKSQHRFLSSIKGERYFINKMGNRNPYAELKSSITVFQNDTVKARDYACLFPARNFLLHLNWPNEIELYKCSDFEKWKEGINAGTLYLVYSSAYPNNPASMFGHTFLRFDRKSKTQSNTAQEYLGYSFAYQAKTNPADNAFIYTLKGLMGGYYTYLNIDPHYMNIGMYNNFESRDLWEYKISLSNFEKELLIRHLWEISISGAFDYYFLNKNCSTLMIKTLEVIKLNWDLKSKNTLFVVPVEVVKEIGLLENSKTPIQRISIQKKIQRRMNKFNEKQFNLFKNALKNENELNSLSDIFVLDTIIEFWKFRNYKYKTKLPDEQKHLMYAALNRRSTLPTQSRFEYESEHQNMAPHLSHDISKLDINILRSKANIHLRYGFHSFEDPSLGNDGSSHFRFLKSVLTKEQEIYYLSQIEFLDILSLQDFTFAMPELSWRANISHLKTLNENFISFSGGLGISQKKNKIQSYLLFGGEFNKDTTRKKSKLKANYYLGMKYEKNERVWYHFTSNLDFMSEIDTVNYNIGLSYLLKRKNDLILKLNFYKNADELSPGLGLSTFF